MPPYINIHTHHPEPDTVALTNLRLSGGGAAGPETGYFSAGIHPWDTADARQEWLSIFRSAPANLIAVGETGLDHRPEFAPYEKQEFWFKTQIAIANELSKPLIIHNVHATEDTMTVLKAEAEVPVILHSFSGSAETVKQWLQAVPAVRFSFGPTLARSVRAQQALRWLTRERPDRFFLETDDIPNISIEQMYTLTTEITGSASPTLKERIAQNFNLLFPLIDLR